MFKVGYYSVELSLISAELFKDYLCKESIRFEPSSCYNLTHFEIFVTSQKEYDSINSFLEFLPV